MAGRVGIAGRSVPSRRQTRSWWQGCKYENSFLLPLFFSLNKPVVFLYSFGNFRKCCFVTDFVVKGLVWDGMGFAVGRHSVATDLNIVQYSRSLLGLVFVVGVVSLKRFFPWPVFNNQINNIHSVQFTRDLRLALITSLLI